MKSAEGRKYKEALLWKKLQEKKVQCSLCNRFCAIDDGQTGFCRVRKNINGRLVSLVYGRTLTLETDPIEKKPLFNFKPGSHCTGVSTFGCNFRCLHCQNYSISQEFTEEAISLVPFTEPKAVVEFTAESGVEGISYTYTEPTIFAEYALDIMKAARKKGLYNVWVSNGYMSKEAADLIIPHLDAINIDLKGNEKFYKEVCGNAERKFVMENIKYFHSKGVHVEVTNLVIPSYNDTAKDFKEVSSFIASVDRDMPLHFTAFFPMYKLDRLPATDRSTLEKAKDTAKKERLSYVYLGNIREEGNTRCKKCGNLLVRRLFYDTEITGLDGRKCGKCGTENNFVL
jgi:pyruvate formate lyase activating enzyme